MKDHIRQLLESDEFRGKDEDKIIIREIHSQEDFDELFAYFFIARRVFANRAADAVEKISREHPEYLAKHRSAILKALPHIENKELKWSIADMLPRLELSKQQLGKCWDILSDWARDKNASRILRTNAIQALFDLLPRDKRLYDDMLLILEELEGQNIPSLQARIRNMRKKLGM